MSTNTDTKIPDPKTATPVVPPAATEKEPAKAEPVAGTEPKAKQS